MLLHEHYIGMLRRSEEVTDLADSDGEFRGIIEVRLPALLLSVDGASTETARRSNIEALQAEGHHDWNALCYNFFHRSQATHSISNQVL